MRALAQQLLRGPSPISPADRELIAAYVSSRNECRFCTRSHAAVARKLGDPALVDAVLRDPKTAPISEKLRVLLAIAESVRSTVAPVPDALLAEARKLGAGDVEIHDAVLVAAAFSMFNRYVDGLAADTPDEGPAYTATAERLTTQGYVP
jgi:uncharacterized peroxidase-related enzyme